MIPFGTRLRAAMDTRGPLCVGIDPHAALLSAWGLSDDVAGLERFARTVVAALADRVAVLKPQSAFFERHGSRGVAVLERTIVDARAAGALVLLDAKRGDIGSTMAGYADAYLAKDGPLAADALTVSPYLGFGSLAPALESAAQNGTGVFVLCRTSNPDGGAVQEATGADGRSVAAAIAVEAARRNAGAEPLGDVGLVVGGNLSRATLAGLDLAAVNGPLLAPGMGTQGGTADALSGAFAGALGAVLPSYSREVLERGPAVGALRAAAERVGAACRDALGA